MRPWAKAAALAELQHLVVAVWQLRCLGLSEQSIQRRVTDHGWRRWTPGVYLLPGPITPLRQAAAAVLAYSRPTNAAMRFAERREEHPDESEAEALARLALESGRVLCGLTAAWLHGLTTAPSTTWLRVPTHCGLPARKLVRLRHGGYSGVVVWLEGLPVVDVEQALIDIAGMKDGAATVHHRLTKLIATAHALRRTTLDAIERRLTEAANFRGKPALRRAVDDLRGTLSHSKPEAEARVIVARVLARFGHVLEPAPYPIRIQGRIVGEADLAVVAICLDIEVDGPHHGLPEQQEKDTARDRLVRRAGWTVERFTTELIELRPKVFEARVTDAVRHLLTETS